MSSPPPEIVVKNRFLGFLIWQSITTTAVFLFFRIFVLSLLSAAAGKSFVPSVLSLLAFAAFHLSQLLFSASLSILSSPRLNSHASPVQIAQALIRFLFVSGESLSSRDFRLRARVSLSFVLFVVVSAVSGFVSAISMSLGGYDVNPVRLVGTVGLRGLSLGLLYSMFYIYKQRWVLEFPIIQRPPFFSFKMGLPLAVKRAFKLSNVAYLFSLLLLVIVPYHFESPATLGRYISEQISQYLGGFAVLFSWELSHHLHQVLHTKRFIFAPPKGSAAAETNPSEPLLEALEESTPNSLLHYLAYLDLTMVCENNVDTWRRAAFFEETGDTYKRVVAVCLRPLEQLAANLSEDLEGYGDKAYRLDNQMQSPTDAQPDSKFLEQLKNFQQCTWCARSIASLTARSHQEDRYGVAQLSGSNAAVTSTLLSCLLAVETLMGKKTHLQSQNPLMGPAGIKWANMNTARRDVSMAKKRGGQLHSKAYAMADVLRTSIYSIVSAFHNEMLTSGKAGLLEKDWLASGKPFFGSRELLLQKLHLFLDFQAS